MKRSFAFVYMTLVLLTGNVAFGQTSYKINDQSIKKPARSKSIDARVETLASRIHQDNIEACIGRAAQACDGNLRMAISLKVSANRASYLPAPALSTALPSCGHLSIMSSLPGEKFERSGAEVFKTKSGKIIWVRTTLEKAAKIPSDEGAASDAELNSPEKEDQLCRANVVSIPSGVKQMVISKSRAWFLGNNGKVYFMYVNNKNAYEYQGSDLKNVSKITVDVTSPSGDDVVTFNTSSGVVKKVASTMRKDSVLNVMGSAPVTSGFVNLFQTNLN